MKGMFSKGLLYQNKGITLIEIILSIAILGLIIISFLNILVFSTRANRESGNILDASYIVQGIMEERYRESKLGEKIPENNEYPDPSGGSYWIDEKVIVDEGNLVRVIVKVYSDESKDRLKAQMETYLLWNED